mgnify:CR=1 FL=1
MGLHRMTVWGLRLKGNIAAWSVTRRASHTGRLTDQVRIIPERERNAAMRIEHFAYQVEYPGETADWYCTHLGFTIKRAADEPVPVRFLADESDRVMLEIYNNPKVSTPDYASMDPLLLHVAFVCPDVPATVERLLAAGASLVSGPETLDGGDQLAMLRDPWGLAIQLANRSKPMVEP